MLEFCKLIFEINFFIFPISAGILAYKKIHGKPADRFFRLMISSLVMLVLSYTGVFVNETPEHRAEILSNLERLAEEGAQE